MQEKDFISYEYKTVSVKARDEARTTDLYEAFGWEVSNAATSVTGNATLSFRRDRKQRHRAELAKLERQAEQTLETLHGLERAKTLGAGVFAWVFGVISALVLGGGMSLVMLREGSAAAMAGGILLGVLGIALCAVNYFLYKKLAAKKTKTLLPVIDETEEALANLLEKGNDLLRTELL